MKKKKNSRNMALIDTKTFLDMKNKGWLTRQKIIINYGKIKMLHNKRLVLKVLG